MDRVGAWAVRFAVRRSLRRQLFGRARGGEQSFRAFVQINLLPRAR